MGIDLSLWRAVNGRFVHSKASTMLRISGNHTQMEFLGNTLNSFKISFMMKELCMQMLLFFPFIALFLMCCVVTTCAKGAKFLLNLVALVILYEILFLKFQPPHSVVVRMGPCHNL